MAVILIVEDDLNTATVLKDSLMAYSHTVEISDDGTDALFLAKSYDYDAILLDNSLPGKDGMSICRDIRAAGKTVGMFVSNAAERDRFAALGVEWIVVSSDQSLLRLAANAIVPGA